MKLLVTVSYDMPWYGTVWKCVSWNGLGMWYNGENRQFVSWLVLVILTHWKLAREAGTWGTSQMQHKGFGCMMFNALGFPMVLTPQASQLTFFVWGNPWEIHFPNQMWYGKVLGVWCLVHWFFQWFWHLKPPNLHFWCGGILGKYIS